MDCIKQHYQVVLSHILRGNIKYCPLDVFETSKIIDFTNDWCVDLVYNERINCTVRKITFITTKDFYQLLTVFGDDYDISYKYLKKELFENE